MLTPVLFNTEVAEHFSHIRGCYMNIHWENIKNCPVKTRLDGPISGWKEQAIQCPCPFLLNSLMYLLGHMNALMLIAGIIGHL